MATLIPDVLRNYTLLVAGSPVIMNDAWRRAGVVVVDDASSSRPPVPDGLSPHDGPPPRPPRPPLWETEPGKEEGGNVLAPLARHAIELVKWYLPVFVVRGADVLATAVGRLGQVEMAEKVVESRDLKMAVIVSYSGRQRERKRW
jgi:hypothetical protein